MTNKYFFLILVMLLMLNVVAAKPLIDVTNDNGFNVEPTLKEVIKQNTDHEFEIHVFNKTNGAPIISGVSCYAHLYGGDGNHIYTGEDSTTDHTFDYSFDLDKGNFTTLGKYQLKVQCNNSVAGGAREIDFEVTETGKDLPEGNVMVFLMIFALAALLFLLWTLLKIIKDLAAIEVNMVTVSLGLAAYFSNLALYYYLTLFMPLNLMLELSFIGISAFGVTHIFLPLVGLIFSWIKNGRTY